MYFLRFCEICTVIAVPEAARRGHQIPCWTVVSHPTWKLGTELGASRTATRALKHSNISPVADPTHQKEKCILKAL